MKNVWFAKTKKDIVYFAFKFGYEARYSGKQKRFYYRKINLI